MRKVLFLIFLLIVGFLLASCAKKAEKAGIRRKPIFLARKAKKERRERPLSKQKAAKEKEVEVLVSQLVEGSRSSDKEVRQTALELLGEVGGEPAVLAISNGLKNPDPDIRRAALSALEMILVRATEPAEKQTALDLLLPVVNDPEEDIRSNAVKLLAVFGEKKRR